MAWTEPLDLWNILITDFAGGVNILISIIIIVIAIGSKRFNIPDQITLLLIGIFFISSSIALGSIYMLPVIIIGGLITYYAVARIVK